MWFNVFQMFITRDLRSGNIQLYFQTLTQLIIYFLISLPFELQELLSWRFINTLWCSTICSACLLTSGCLWNHTRVPKQGLNAIYGACAKLHSSP